MNEQGIDSLCNGIIVQACKDYRSALAGNNVNGRKPQWVIEECESFFLSDWFSILTKVDPHYIMREIRKEFNL